MALLEQPYVLLAGLPPGEWAATVCRVAGGHRVQHVEEWQTIELGPDGGGRLRFRVSAEVARRLPR